MHILLIFDVAIQLHNYRLSQDQRYSVWEMFNFKLQLDRVTGSPDIRLNVILSRSVRVFLGKINIRIQRLSKANRPSQYGEPHSICESPKQNKNAEGGRIFSLLLFVCLWPGTLVLYCLWTEWSLYHWLFRVLALWTQTGRRVSSALLAL